MCWIQHTKRIEAEKMVTVVCFAALTDNLFKFQAKKNSHSLVYPFLKICNHRKVQYE